MTKSTLAVLALLLSFGAAAATAKKPAKAGSAPEASASAASAPAATAAQAVTTASGLRFEPLTVGKGPHPTATDKVRVHYVGRFLDGREFDSSIKRGEPAEFPLNRVIKCWTEGVQLMQVGGKARLHCPSSIAYGERGAGGGEIPPNTPLVFEVELLAIVGN
ncbi:FKBP-type peptidyl-prolyl cis-trans isomerase [Paucibacter sp. TC2R-5]|uniref:FKBP-type peptidyl-prolyl cis-trans isomerase n=1 Tax=Paucibacter sp. TC2R-5 TaxID=2893555 RepID=UPI0021E3AFD0|nr:FKBP-type peptidyl-prolyl cis-trans isomerase [Paucibacter sp. TC2R-5]MCV2359321.1 FKBP-type peptidyl-prolyl cis-trans isomerase [Paucibacter sp. TC2R-5]